MALASGSRLGSYEILTKLGEGGMGEVYRARDSRLGREVALKVLPPEVTNDPGRLERFDREARAVAALNHPHIVTLYSTEEVDGIRFLTMELVEGQTLTELIVTGRLPIARFLELALQLADALSAAHQKSITHRDLKPGNVMVSREGRVKVLDFGLARIGGLDAGPHSIAATQAPITHLGMIVGTMPYMSPEQIEAQPLDPRSDLFSLGVIFYEMLNGERPFKGASSPALMSSILRDTPSSVSDTRADVPESIARLIARCLEKRPEDRVQTARDVFNELRHVQKQPDSGSAGSTPSTPLKGGAGRVGPAASRNVWVAVVPLAAPTADTEIDALAESLTEDITAGLSRFSYLSVVAAQSARLHKGTTADARRLGHELGARFILEGGIRRAGQSIRLTVRLVDASTGGQLWSETYSSSLAEQEAQNEIADRVVATVADVHGVLLRSMSQGLEDTDINQLDAEGLGLRYWAYHRQHSPTEHGLLRSAFERLVGARPTLAFAWSALAHLYCQEYGFLFNEQPEALARARKALGRATELDPINQHAWEALAFAYFFERDPEGFAHASERSMALNPRNANNLALMAILIGHTGDYDRSRAMAARAMTLNPDHAGWYHIAAANAAYHKGDYAEALRAAKRINMPQHLWAHVLVATAAGQLGRSEAAGAIETLRSLAPGVAEEAAQAEAMRRWKWNASDVEHQMDGYRKALALANTSQPARQPATGSRQPVTGADSTKLPSAERTRTSITVTVHPFTAGSDPAANAIAEGLTTDIATGLARFSYLRVIARPTNARFLVDGSVRSSGSKIRITARLVDAASGAHLWSETFDRDKSEEMFAIQDEIAHRITATVADEDGVIVRMVASILKQRPLAELSIDELVLRFHLYSEQFTGEEHGQLRPAFERALEREPKHGEAWAYLSILYAHELALGHNPLPDSIGRQRQAAERALELDNANQATWMAMMMKSAFARDLASLRVAADRILAINPLSGHFVASCAVFLAFAGDTDRAAELYERAHLLNPNHQGWYFVAPFLQAFRQRRYDRALSLAKRINMPAFAWWHLGAAGAAGHLGDVTDAKAAIEAITRTRPELLNVSAAREIWKAWLADEELVDRLIDGFEKASALTKPGSV